jgi:predicted O-methyltransferase YrrM
MMADKEIFIIDTILDQSKPKVCLEWGSGNSTRYFPKHHKDIVSWTAVEHNGHYVEFLAGKTADNVNVVWADKEWYIDCVKLNGRKYDFILIDGEEREGCIRVALDIIKPGGIILLHDAGRIEFADIIRLYDGRKLLDGEKPVKEGGFAHRGLVAFTL